MTLANDIRILEPGGGAEQFIFDVASGKILEVSGNVYSASQTGQTFVKNGDGTLVLSGTDVDATSNAILLGNNTINAGTLLLNGDMDNNTTETYGAFTIGEGAAIGGNGTWGGGLTLEEGAKLVFSLTDTLGVAGEVSIHGTFGIDDLIGLDSSVADGTYTLIDMTFTDFSSLNLDNLGAENAYDLGDGKSAYFQNGSLQVVVIPEPAALGMIGTAAALMLVVRRWLT